MDAILGFFSFINSLGVSVVMPIVITILGCGSVRALVRACALA